MRLLTLLLFLTSACVGKLTTPKQVYTIGGWNQRGTAEKFLREWSPFFVAYLTSKVGPLYDPPISFDLIPIDWEENTAAEELIPKGALDFICKFSFIADVNLEICNSGEFHRCGAWTAYLPRRRLRFLANCYAAFICSK